MRQVRTKKANVSKPSMTYRKRLDDVKTEGSLYLGISVGDTCILPVRRPV